MHCGPERTTSRRRGSIPESDIEGEVPGSIERYTRLALRMWDRMEFERKKGKKPAYMRNLDDILNSRNKALIFITAEDLPPIT